MKFRHYYFLGVVVLSPGCAFFGVERTDCLPDDDCSAGLSGGDGDGDIGGDGDGDVQSSGGSGDGDGDGDVSTGGAGDGDIMGGAPSTGGRRGTGGAPAGGSGGEPNGGMGGASDGGTGGGSGGEPSGGSGGMSTGGTDSMTIVNLVASDLQINEIYSQFVEIYFLHREEASFSLDNFRIVVNGQAGKACQLTGGFVDASSPYLVAQRAPKPCLGGSNCVAECAFDSIADLVEVRLEMLINGSYETIDTQANAFLGGGESYQARPNGTDGFTKSAPSTPGATNEE